MPPLCHNAPNRPSGDTRPIPGTILVTILALSAALCACAPPPTFDPELTRAGVEAAYTACPLWGETVTGFDAAIRPRGALSGDTNMLFHAAYRADRQSDGAKCVLFLPHGVKLGQCERNGTAVACSSLAFAGADSLLRSIFTALDISYRLRPSRDDGWEPRRERLPNGMTTTVLRRTGIRDSVRYAVIHTLAGIPIFVRRESAPTAFVDPGGAPSPAWQADFNGEPDTLTITDDAASLIMDLRITRYRMRE